MITTKTVSITPALAAEYLKKITSEEDHRNVAPVTRQSYVNDMRRGEWLITHQGICFDDSGYLMDGRHRLRAIIESGVTVEMRVTYGVPAMQGKYNTFDAIDRGRTRSINSQLSIRHKIKNSSEVAAACSMIVHVCTGSNIKMTVQSTLDVYSIYHESINFAIREISATKIFKSAGIIGTLSFCRECEEEKMSKFITQVGSGSNLQSGDPAYALRAFYILNHGWHTSMFVNATMTAAKYFFDGQKLFKVYSKRAGIDWWRDEYPTNVRKIREIVGYKTLGEIE